MVFGGFSFRLFDEGFLVCPLSLDVLALCGVYRLVFFVSLDGLVLLAFVFFFGCREVKLRCERRLFMWGFGEEEGGGGSRRIDLLSTTSLFVQVRRSTLTTLRIADRKQCQI
jgi:hypothetical protein